MSYHGKWPTVEDDLKILKILSQQPLIVSSSYFNLSSGDQTEIQNAWNEDNLQWKWKIIPKYYNSDISATTDQIFLKF